ncbi:putative MFS-type transporter C09D4.1-like isoform X2, partial [Leptotrombidium deliense]
MNQNTNNSSAITSSRECLINYRTVDTYRVYYKRFLILLLFCLYSMSNALQWIEYSVINNIVSYYYGVSESTVNLTSVIYMI